MMDVMSPDLFWVDDRCYRLPVLDSLNVGNECQRTETILGEASNCDGTNYSENDEDISNYEDLVETLSDNRYKISLLIPQSFWSKIIGTKGATKRRIETDTKTLIYVPKPMEHGDIVIKGSSKKDVILAMKNINAIVASTRQKLIFTHFISVPMTGENIKKNFIIFKKEVLKLFGGDRGVDESIFQHPDKLHLTLGTLVLTDQNERNLAEKLLNEVNEKSLKLLTSKSENCLIEMRGIEYMNDDPAEVDVLYGKIKTNTEENLIQKIADSVLRYFNHHKLIKSDNFEHVKLHVTLMNTLFREEDLEELNTEIETLNKNKCGNQKTRRTFNATNILQKFYNFYFGEQELKTIHLSVRFSTGKDGYYKSSCILNL